MKYLLTMTTSGRRDCFLRTVETFVARVKPQPTEVYVYDDGRKTGVEEMVRASALSDYFSAIRVAPAKRFGLNRAVGFCKATGACFAAAAESPYDWWFHLEDDFEFLRALDLRDLAHVLSLEPNVVQMALMRDAVNDLEKAAGGLYESRRDEFAPRGIASANAWLEHRSYFTTNPSLLRTDIARRYGWPDEDHCEGVYGIKLRELRPHTTFGAWGTGTPWVRHIGERQGFGY